MSELDALLLEHNVPAEITTWLLSKTASLESFANLAGSAKEVYGALPPPLPPLLDQKRKGFSVQDRKLFRDALTKLITAWLAARQRAAVPLRARIFVKWLNAGCWLSSLNNANWNMKLWVLNSAEIVLFGRGPHRLPLWWSPQARVGLLPRAGLLALGLNMFSAVLGTMMLGVDHAKHNFLLRLDAGGWPSRVCLALACCCTAACMRYVPTLSAEGLRMFVIQWIEDVRSCVDVNPRLARALLALPPLSLFVMGLFRPCGLVQRMALGTSLVMVASLVDSFVAKRRARFCDMQEGEAVEAPSYWDLTKRTAVEVSTSPWQTLLDETWVVETAVARDRAFAQPRMLHLKSAYRIQNPSLWQRYNAARAEAAAEVVECTPLQTDALLPQMLEGTLDPAANEHMLFHGTSVEGAEAIARDGFKLSRAGTAVGSAYGAGCYFAENSSKSEQYVKEAEGLVSRGRCAILVCRVAMGAVTKVEAATTGSAGPTRLVDRGMVNGRKSYREVVIFDERRSYPEWLLVYETSNENAAPKAKAVPKPKAVPAPPAPAPSASPIPTVTQPPAERRSSTGLHVRQRFRDSWAAFAGPR